MRRLSCLTVLVVGLLAADPARASTEATFVFGSLLGDDLLDIVQGDLSLKSSFENAPLFGGRFGWYGFPLGVEGSVVITNSDLSVGDSILSLESRIIYAEANAMVLILPGVVQPYVTGGGGVHDFKLKGFEGAEVAKFGWNFGFGVKVNVSRVAFRFDVRDHRTSFKADEFDVDPEIIDVLGIDEITLDNVEVSFGFAVRF